MKKPKPDRRKKPDHPPLPGNLRACPLCHKMTLVYVPRGESLESISIKIGLEWSEKTEIHKAGSGWFCRCGHREFTEEPRTSAMFQERNKH